jgi:hypothetical protein
MEAQIIGKHEINMGLADETSVTAGSRVRESGLESPASSRSSSNSGSPPLVRHSRSPPAPPFVNIGTGFDRPVEGINESRSHGVMDRGAYFRSA